MISGGCLLAALCVVLLGGCFGGEPDPYAPHRPYLAPDGGWSARPAQEAAFPERNLRAITAGTPPQVLAQIDRIFRGIAVIDDDANPLDLLVLQAEIDSIESAVSQLGLTGGSLMRLRLNGADGLEAEEREAFTEAAALYTRWGLALMRTGDTDRRMHGAEKIREAMKFDPENPLLVVLLASYLDMAGFRSNAVSELDAFVKEHGTHDTVDLQRLRKRERTWKLLNYPEDLRAATLICDTMCARHGTWDEAPVWLRVERARLYYLADSTAAALALVDSAIEALQPSYDDTLTAVQALMLKGVIDVGRLEFERADASFMRAVDLAMQSPVTAEFASWLRVPWDLLTDEERLEFDGSLHRDTWVDDFWAQRDPILATPKVLENRVEYWRRVGEAWFVFDGLDVSQPGPLTAPGKAVLRFGWPTEWQRLGSRDLDGEQTSDGIFLTWQFLYHLNDGFAVTDRRVRFQDRGGRSRFVATDSLRGPSWPPYWFNYDFLGRGYRLNADAARFRQLDGRTRLLVSFDTLVPNYSVRYPMQGFRYEGRSNVRSALLRKLPEQWIVAQTERTAMEEETSIHNEREFRRRAGWTDFVDVERDVYRLATLMNLRDQSDEVVAISVDNGEAFVVPGFGFEELEASDLLMTSSIAGMMQEDVEHEPKEGLIVYGPDPEQFEIVPRASRRFLQGEDLAFYLEIYNLDTRRGVASVDLKVILEKLDEAGEVEYSVTVSGASFSLIKYGVKQWNVVRSLGMNDLQPGKYRLVVDIHDRAASRRLTRSEDFEFVMPEDLIELYRWRQLPAPKMANLVEPGGQE